MGLLDGIIKGHVARKARKKLGSYAPLVAGALMLVGFVLQLTGDVAASDFVMQVYKTLGVESPISPETLTALRDAVNALVPALYAWLGPVVGAGAAYKIQQKRKDAKGQLSKPPVLSTDDHAFIADTDPQAARFMAQWRHLMNDEGWPSDRAIREARRRVYG